jgi:hypothetical protein
MTFHLRFFVAFLVLLGSGAFAQTQDAVEDSVEAEASALEVLLEEELADSQIKEVYPVDTLAIAPRDFDESKLNELRKDEDYNYTEPPTVAESLWDRFWRWIAQFFSVVFNEMAYTDWGNVLLYVLAVCVLVIIVLAVLKVDAFRVLSGSDKNVTKGVFHENIHEMDFDVLIKEALAKRDFRNAVRLVFLQSLKLLSDKQHIDWQPGKTNHDYLDEVQSVDVKKGLGQLSYYFDYAWYGGFTISETQFSRVKTIFDSWQNSVK